MQGLVNGTLGGEREAGVNLGGDTSWNNLEDLLSELDEEAVEGSIDLGVDVRSTVLLSVSDGNIHKLGVLGLLGRSEDQGGVGGGILRLVLADSCLDVSMKHRGGWNGRVASDCDVAAVEWGFVGMAGYTHRQSHLEEQLASCFGEKKFGWKLTRVRDNGL